jgi:hypothetical protein
VAVAATDNVAVATRVAKSKHCRIPQNVFLLLAAAALNTAVEVGCHYDNIPCSNYAKANIGELN